MTSSCWKYLACFWVLRHFLHWRQWLFSHFVIFCG